MNALRYKPNLKEAQTRLQSLYVREAGDRIFAVMDVPNKAIRNSPRPTHTASANILIRRNGSAFGTNSFAIGPPWTTTACPPPT